MNDPKDSGSSAGAVAAPQKGAAPLTVFAAPATGDEFNTLGERLVPKGCFRIEDLLFEFDSSFVLPGIETHLPKLVKLRNDNKRGDLMPPLSIFGHADPVGKDDYNKQLSGRRATAIYAMLVRDVDLWEELFTPAPQVAGDKWGTRAIQAMLSRVQGPLTVDGVIGDGTRSAIRTFQKANGLSVDGTAGPNTRKVLYRAYMDALCGPNLLLDKAKDFLARNQDGGKTKGDVQGCGEFNALSRFSKDEEARFAAAADKTKRNDENAPNRRVMILVFAAGRRVNPAVWPCPRVSEGVAACKKRFFPDAERRRSAQAERRAFEDTKDTFACRFYQIISDDSPCERVTPIPVALYRVVVVDEFDTPLAGVSVTLTAPNFEQTLPTDSAGVVQFSASAGGGTALVLNDKRLSDTLAALVDKAPRDKPPPKRAGFVAITPSMTKAPLPIAAGVPHTIMIIARTDVVFELPKGWGDLAPSATGPWRLSKNGSSAILRLVSQGLGRSVTLQSPAITPAFAGKFVPSPLWTSDRKRILQPDENLAALARKYLGDVSDVDQLITLNPRFGATGTEVKGPGPGPVTMPTDAIPGWLSIPQTVRSLAGTTDEDVFATIDVDELHDALFARDADAVWNILSALPRDQRNNSRISGDALLEIYVQSLLADLLAG